MPETLIEGPLSVFRKAAFIGCTVALAVLAWLPAQAMTRTMLGGHAEHLIAYLGTAIVMGLAFQKRPRPAVQCVLLIAYAGVLEVGQLYSPGRHASFQDMAFSSTGVVLGGLFLWMARTRIARWRTGSSVVPRAGRVSSHLRLMAFMICSGVWLAGAGALQAQTRAYNWSDIDCRQSRIVVGPSMKCRATNVVTSEGNIGVFRQWAAFGTATENYIHVFTWEAQNSFSYLNADQTTVEFLKWMYENGQFATQFSAVARYHEADYATFRDDKHKLSCVGFRRMGKPQRGGYESLTGAIMCAPPGKTLANDDITRFIDRVQLQ
jgi:VanZ family protein